MPQAPPGQPNRAQRLHAIGFSMPPLKGGLKSTGKKSDRRPARPFCPAPVVCYRAFIHIWSDIRGEHNETDSLLRAVVAGRQRSAGLGCSRAGQRTIDRATAVHGRGTRFADRSHRPLPGRPVVADPDGLDLSAGGRFGRPLGQGQSGCQRRRRAEEGRERDLGRQRQVARRLPQHPRHDEREARLDAEAGRRLSRPAEGRARLGPAPAPTGQEQWQPGEQPATGRAQ